MREHEGMDENLTGRLLVAAPTLIDPNFFRTVVLLLGHDHDGAVGVVLNRPSNEPVGGHLPAWADAVGERDVVFVGGPVQPEVAVGLVSHGGVEQLGIAGVEVADLGADPPPGARARVFSGYAGWAPGQLEAELEERAWMVLEAEPADVFGSRPEELWSAVLRRQPAPMSMLATFPVDPDLN